MGMNYSKSERAARLFDMMRDYGHPQMELAL